ncbi:MAG: class I tRNA ligase family protein [Patescibacteria group bacterium]
MTAWEKLRISYTDYIRTSEPRHHEFVKKIILKCHENGDIYK